MNLKYLINEKIDLQPKSLGVEVIAKIIERDHKISRSTFHRDRNILLSDKNSITIDRLEIYSALLGCTVDDLKNYTSKKIKPLADRKVSKNQNLIVKAGKMVKGSAKLLLLAFLISSCVSYKGLGKCPSYKTTPMHVRK